MAEIVKQTGRISYIEPSYSSSIERVSESSIEQYETIHPMEDYSIFINLQVEVRGRTIRTNGGTEKNTYIMTWESDQKTSTVNFMSGSKIPVGDRGSGKFINSLTTNYTNTFITDLQKEKNDGKIDDPTIEMFGISSIDVSYNNFMVPEVTINFIDVRGISLFAQEEYRHGNNADAYSDATIAGSFFKCFFTFPYPKFTLFVKGFYGEPVAYELTCSDFRARFDSNTGNFGATAKFVGFAFSFLGDVSLRGILAAPYSDYIGAEYWDSKVASGDFFVYDDNGQKANMVRFGELVSNIKEITETANSLAQSNPVIQEKSIIDDKNKKLLELSNRYATYSEVIKNIVKAKFRKVGSTNMNGIVSVTDIDGSSNLRSAVFLTQDKTFKGTFAEYVGDDESGYIQNAFDNLKSSIEEYNASYGTSLPIPPNMAKETVRRVFGKDKRGKVGVIVDSSSVAELIKGNRDSDLNRIDLYNRLVNYVNRKDGELVYSKKIDEIGGLSGFLFRDSKADAVSLQVLLSRESDNISNEMSDVTSKVDDAVDEAITNSLGFPPTIENMTRMLMAHFETFAYMIFKTGESICSNMNTRTLDMLGISKEDVTDVSTKNGTKFIPPFPKVTHLTHSFGEETREDSWVGNYNGDFLEKDLIHGLINGTIEFAKKQELSTNKGTLSQASIMAKTKMKVPVIPFDFSSTKDVYGSMGNFVNNDELAGQLAQRAFGILSTTSIKDGVKAKDLGAIEAYNFFDLYPQPTGSLYGVVNDTNFSQSLIDILTTKSYSHPWSNDKFLDMSSKYSKANLTNISSYSIYGSTTRGGSSYLPLQGLSSTKCAKYKKDVLNHTIPNVYKDSDYVISQAHANKDIYCENVYTLEKNPVRYKVILDNQYALSDETKSLMALYNDAANLNSGLIDGFFREKGKERIVGSFETQGDPVPKEGSCIFPNSISMQCEKSVFKDNTPKGNIDLKRVEGKNFSYYASDLNISDVTIDSFFGIANYQDETSIFGQRIYYSTSNIYDKAYYFLRSLGGFFDYEEIWENYLCDNRSDKQLIVLPYAAVLHAGAIIHRETEETKNEHLKKLSKNFKRKLKHDFEEWAANDFDKNINSQLAIANSLDHYDKIVPNITSSWPLRRAFEDMSDGKCGVDELGVIHNFKKANSTFFRNYISVGSTLWRHDIDDNYRGIKLINRPEGPGVVAAKNFILSFVGLSKNISTTGELRVSEADFVAFFNGFTNKLKELYGNAAQVANESLQIERAKDPNDMTDENIKISLYRYCKMLYDKWVGGLSSYDFDIEWTSKRFFGDNGNTKNRYFYFIDEYYSSANDFFLNVGEMCEMINNAWFQDDYTLLSYIYDTYAKNKFQFFCIQNFLDYGDNEKLSKMFTPVPTNSMQMPNRISNFIAMYASEKSSNLDFGQNNEYKDDSFCVNVENGNGGNMWPKALLSRDVASGNNLTIPAFGVSYGKLYQSYFKNVDVGMDNPIVTEQALKAQYRIASMENEGNSSNPRSAEMMGQDLFTVYSNNSYTCTVEMMGCAWVQPLMYFVLSNVPMFRGTYLIIKVNHKLEPGNMITTFTGVRMSNIRTRKNSNWLQRKKANRVGGQGLEDIEAIKNSLANVENDCPYPAYPIMAGDQNGGGIPESFLKMKFSKLRDMTPNRGVQKIKTKSGTYVDKPMAPYFDRTDITVEQALVVMIAAEYKSFSSNDYLMAKVSAALACNRYHYCKAQNNYTWLIGTLQMGTGNSSATANLYDQYKDKLTPILRNGGGLLVGKVAKVKEGCNVEIWNQGTTQHKKAPNTHTITLDDVRSLFLYCTMGGYDYEHIGSDSSKVGNQTSFETKAKPNNGNSTWKKGKFLFQEYNTVFISNAEHPDKKFWEPIPKPLNDNKSKIKEFSMGFYNAVRMSSDNSAVKCEFGVSKEKSKGYHLYLTNGKNNKGFGRIFDIILNTNEYYSHVKEIKWVTTENKLKGNPNAIVVELSETPYNGAKRIGISYDDGASISTNKIKSTDINDVFCKAIAKRFTNVKAASTEVFGISDMQTLFNNANITDCDSLVNSNVIYDNLGSGFAGKVTNPKMKKVLSMVDFLCHAHQYKTASEWYVVRGLGNNGKVRDSGKVKCGNSVITVSKPASQGWCTFGPSTWYQQAGIDIHFGGDPHQRTYKSEVTEGIQKYGFKLVWSGTVEAALNLPNSRFRPGDVATEYYYKDNGVRSGHACMWTGSDWRSDFVQQTIMASTKYKGREGDKSVCIWRHPDFQEPGLSLD